MNLFQNLKLKIQNFVSRGSIPLEGTMFGARNIRKLSRGERDYPLTGFTLVETLVGIAILVVAILAPLSIAQSGLQAARYAQDQTTATFLAQEAIELVKYQVATNMSKGDPWLTGVVDGTTNCDASSIGVDCQVDASTGAISVCLLACIVSFNSANNMYGTVGTQTKFTREIRVAQVGVNSDQEEKIIVTMTWKTPSGTDKTYIVEDTMFKWR